MRIRDADQTNHLFHNRTESDIEKVRPSGYQDAATTYRDLGYEIIPVHGKHGIPAGTTGRAGVVDDTKIAAWCADPEWADANLAIRFDGNTIGIDVDHYGDKHGADQLAELEAALGSLPATITNTSRGADSPSRQHVFLLPENVELVSKAAPDIDILRREHRFAVCWPSRHVDTGEQYQWYGFDGELLEEPPAPGDFEILPQAWLDFLTAEAPEEHAGFSGAIDEWVETLISGAPSAKVRAFIEAIPADNFTHQDVVGVTWRLVRLGAERERGVKHAIDALYAAWVKPPYDGPEYRKELDVAIRGAIRKAGAPEIVADVPALLPGVDVFNALPEFAGTGEEFMDLIITEPSVKTDAAFTESRRILIREILAVPLTPQHALTAAWNAKVGKPLQAHPDGLERLWREVQAQLAPVGVEPGNQGVVVDTTPANHPVIPVGSLTFLNGAERAYLADQGTWWGSRYLEWAAERVPVFNAPYHRMNRWTVASLVFAEQGHIRTRAQRVHLNLYPMVLGETTTGKTESFALAEQVIDAVFGHEHSPYIGNLSKMSSNGMHAALIRRDGHSSLIRSDEAQGLLESVKKADWQRGLLADVADYYEGKIRAKQMNTDKDLSGISATGNVVAHLTGIKDEVLAELELSHWRSGLLPRFVWAIGDPFALTEESFEETQYEGDDSEDFELMPKQWAAEFAATRRANEGAGGPWRPVRFDADALARHTQLNRQIHEALKNHPRYDTVLRAAKIRFLMSVRKCAAIIALSEASETITLRHELLAVEQAEEWCSVMVQMLDKTAETSFDREVQEVDLLIGKKGGVVAESEIFKQFKPKERAERILSQLVSEGRIERDNDSQGTKVARAVKGRLAA